jgi:molybdate transport system substrate-binding protein
VRRELVLSVALALLIYSAASAEEIRVISAVALADVLKEIGPQFERSTGHKLRMQFGPPVALKARVEAGETFDLVILTPAFIDDVAKQGKVDANSRADIARDGIGVAVRTGGLKPNLASLEGFKRAMLGAKSIIINTGGAAGPVYFDEMFRRLGIAQEIAPKIKLRPTPQDTLEAVANGDGEFGFVIVSMIRKANGVELAGALPPELQKYLTFTGAIGSNTKEADGARALLKFLTSEIGANAIKHSGLDLVAQ